MSQLIMKDDHDDDEAEKFGEEEIVFGEATDFGDIFDNDDYEIEDGPEETSGDLLNDLLQDFGQDFGGLGETHDGIHYREQEQISSKNVSTIFHFS